MLTLKLSCKNLCFYNHHQCSYFKHKKANFFKDCNIVLTCKYSRKIFECSLINKFMFVRDQSSFMQGGGKIFIGLVSCIFQMTGDRPIINEFRWDELGFFNIWSLINADNFYFEIIAVGHGSSRLRLFELAGDTIERI